jgi:tetratricopeptide (TPR) repeat protein
MSLGRLGPALASMDKAIVLAAATGNPIALAGSRAELAEAYSLLGRPVLALQTAEVAVQAGRERFPLIVPWTLANQASVYLRAGQLAQAEALVAQLPPYQTYRLALSFMPPGWVRVALVTAGVHLEAGRLDRSAADAVALLADFRRMSMSTAEADALLLLARVRLAQGQPAEAEDLLRHADRLTLEQANVLTRWPVLDLLADLAQARRAPAEAAALRAEAHQLVQAMAATLPDQALRASFLATHGIPTPP